MVKYYKSKEATEKLGIHFQTLRNWRKDGKIKTIKIGSRYLYDVNSLLEEQGEKIEDKKNICYCRVSTHGQKIELKNQIKMMKEAYPDYEILTDIGSGINFKRPNFLKILEYGINNMLNELVIAYKDRLCRISYDLIEYILTKHSNSKITILNEDKSSPEKEVTDDLIQIITVFSSRLYGMRSYGKKK